MRILFISVLCLWQMIAYSAEPQLKFIKNIGQQHPNVLYSSELSTGAVYLERSSLTYVFYNASDLEKADKYFHDCKHLNPDNACSPLHGHAYKVHFKNSNPNPGIKEQEKLKEYHNYFFGQDKSKWEGNVPLFRSIFYNDIYPGIALRVYSEEKNPKYDFMVSKGADASHIVLNFEGTNGLQVENGNLKIKTSIGDVMEQQPYAFQIMDGKRKVVCCQYKLSRNNVSFRFPEGYDSRYELVIDPVIVACTYAGDTYRSYAHTATYDQQGNIYSAGRAFSVNTNGTGAGYPATLGAFQTTHHGGFQDVCVSKYNPDGSSLIWATYIGGSEQEQPHSLFVDAHNQLYIYGTSNSPNYPVSATGYKRTNPADNFGNILNDIIVTKLNAAGSALLGSTYVGGRTENDGYNYVEKYFGDYFKGEIVVDSAGNAYIASYGRSTDFPTTAGVIQPTYGGGYQDGVVFKLNSDLSSLVWSTFLGGPKEDACYGLKLDANGDLFVTGAVSSNILTNTSGTINTSYIGGLFDAFVAHIRGDGQVMLKSTYFGSVSEEQAYLLDLDKAGNVYIFGATPNPSIQSTPGAYQGVIGGSFIAKLKPTLDSVRFISTFNELAPTALMVDDCGYIYAAGHGGLNASIGTCRGFQLTPDALQRDSGGFYLMTLEPDATALKFGSYFGPKESHVDGGTCRFDKRGIMYNALCTKDPALSTTAWAFHRTKLAVDFDNTVFKIDFQPPVVTATAFVTISPGDTSVSVQGCPPLAVQFISRSVNAAQQKWYFGNGDSSLASAPAYTFATAGLHRVMLVAMNPAACNALDTGYVEVNINSPSVLATHTDAACNSNNGSATATVTAGNGPFNYLWNNNATTPTISGLAAGVYAVTVSGAGGCSATAAVTVGVPGAVTLNASATNTACNSSLGSATVTILSGTAPFVYLWNNGGTLATISNLSSGNYSVTVTGTGNCTATATTTVISSNGVTLTTASTHTVCGNNNGSVTVTATTGAAPFNYLWNNGGMLPSLSNVAAGTYTVTVGDGNSCSATASVKVDSSASISAFITSDKSIMCSGDTARICVTGTYASYVWNTGPTTRCIDAVQGGNYYVTVTDNAGCSGPTNHLFLGVYPLPPVSVSVNGDTLTAFNEITYQWIDNGVPVQGANSAVYVAPHAGDYTVAVTDSNGCHSISTKVTVVKIGIHDLSGEEEITVYPNPFEGVCRLQVAGYMLNTGLHLVITDVIGRKVWEQKIISPSTNMILQHLQRGVYFMRVEAEGILLATRRIVKQ